MKKNVLFLVAIILFFCDVAIAREVKNDYYNYQLIVSDSCAVNYLKKDSSMVSITSPDKSSVFYVICINTGGHDTVYKNELLETFDSDMFESLKKNPDNKETYFWLSKEDHFYSLEDGATCKTRSLLWNDKAGLLVGFSKEGDMTFIDQCMKDFKSPLALGKIATLIYVFVLMCLFIVFIALWEERKFLAIIYALMVVAGWYYFHWVLDYSANRFILSALG